MIPNQPSREVFSTRSNRICVDEEKRPAVAWTRRSPVTGPAFLDSQWAATECVVPRSKPSRIRRAFSPALESSAT